MKQIFGDVRMPEHFEPLEIDTNLNRAKEPRLNDFKKHEQLAPLIRNALAGVDDEGEGPSNYRRQIVEVGSWMGANAIAMYQATKVPVLCVDTWKGGHDTNGITSAVLGSKLVYETFLNNCRDYLFDGIIPLLGTSEFWALNLPTIHPVVFIDADHQYNSVVQDLNLWWPHVAPGGILIGHDYLSFPDVKMAADQFGIDGHEDELFWKYKSGKEKIHGS